MTRWHITTTITSLQYSDERKIIHRSPSVIRNLEDKELRDKTRPLLPSFDLSGIHESQQRTMGNLLQDKTSRNTNHNVAIVL